MKKGAYDHSLKGQFRSRQLRANMSASEALLWEALRRERLGYRFRSQVRVGGYFLDFYCAKANLCIEVDGEQHERQRRYDKRRDALISSLGIETMRIPAEELYEDALFNRWLKRIRDRCQERVGISHPQPPPSLTNQSEGWGSASTTKERENG